MRCITVRKIDLTERLSKKNTIIAVVCIVVFLIIGFVAAVVGHRAYLDSREAEITNISYSSSAKLFMRADGVTLVCKYSSSDVSVALDKVLSLSKGASLSVVSVVDENGSPVSHSGVSFDVSDGQRYFVILNVKSFGGVHTNGYVLEIVSEEDFDVNGTTPFSFGPIL